MEKDKEKHKGHSTVMTIYTDISKTGCVPAHVWQVYGRSVPGPDLDNLRSWKEACSSSIYRLKYYSWNVSHEKLLCNVETAGSSEIGSVKVQRMLCSQKLCFWYDFVTL